MESYDSALSDTEEVNCKGIKRLGSEWQVIVRKFEPWGCSKVPERNVSWIILGISKIKHRISRRWRVPKVNGKKFSAVGDNIHANVLTQEVSMENAMFPKKFKVLPMIKRSDQEITTESFEYL